MTDRLREYPRFDREMGLHMGSDWEYFQPVNNGARDQFGNRRFTSPGFSYQDQLNRRIESTLLVSPSGENLIKSKPGILSFIDRGLGKILDGYDGRRGFNFHDLTRGNTNISYLIHGSQSLVFLLSVEGQQYVLKTHRFRNGFTICNIPTV